MLRNFRVRITNCRSKKYHFKISDEEGEGSSDELEISSLGVKLAHVNSETRGKFKLKKSAKGVVITSVSPEGAAAEKQLKPGDVILEVGQTEISSPKEVNDKIKMVLKNGSFLININ